MRSIDDILAAARHELHTNPTITVYTFENGVEHRRPANTPHTVELENTEMATDDLGPHKTDDLGRHNKFRQKMFRNLALRTQMWVAFPVMVPFLPFLALGVRNTLAGGSGGIGGDLLEVLYSGELILISTALVAGAIADNAVAMLRGGPARIIDFTIVYMGVTFVIAGSWLYAVIAPSLKEAGQSHSHHVATISVGAFVFSLLIGAATIWLDTTREESSALKSVDKQHV
jgi:hypothetical protein